MELKDKTILISGGAGGIGTAVVHKLLEMGSFVAVADKSLENLQKLEQQISPDKRPSLVTYLLDIGNFEDVERVVEDLFKKRGKIDVLVNNAGINRDGLLLSVTASGLKKHALDDWNETLNSNLNGVFYLTREVAGKMVCARNQGVIINVSSVSSSGNLGQSSYAATKAAVNALTVTWAQELALYGIRVAGISPGLVDTELPRRSLSKNMLQERISKTPLRRMASPEEIAEGIVFIIRNDFFCGRILEIDGGLRL